MKNFFLCLLFGLAIWFVITANASSDLIDRNHNQKDNPKSEKLRTTKPVSRPSYLGETEMVTSWYGAYFQGKLTASRVPFDLSKMTAAHRYLPLGTRLELTNPINNKQVVVEVNDRGPYVDGRDLDISYMAAKKLGMTRTGVRKLKVRII